jgi:quaternary ammonium compound-resistance protein SugE
MAWIYLFFASLFKIAWTFSLKLMDVKKLTAIKWLHFFYDPSGFIVLLPWIGYLVFGLADKILLVLAPGVFNFFLE